MLIIAMICCLPASALAHGGSPIAEQVQDVGDSQWVAQTNFGMVTSADTQTYVCEEAFDGGGRFQMAALDLHRWVVFTREAIWYTEDGCDFEQVRELPEHAAGVATSPERDRVVYVLNAEDPEVGGLWQTEDGRSFTQFDLGVDGLHLSGARFIGEDRLVVSAYPTDLSENGAAHLLLVDLAEGTAEDLGDLSPYERPYMLDGAGGTFAWFAREGTSYIFFWGTPDEPMRDSTELEMWPDGAKVSQNGQTVWIAGAGAEGRGVLEGSMTRFPRFEQRWSDHSALCIGGDADLHLLCASRDREGHDISRVTDGGDFESAVDFVDLTGARDDCPAGSDVATACPPVWPELAAALGIEVEGGEDAGSGEDAGVPADVGSGQESGGSE
ncbi:MAG: hypothetical protein ACLFVJ_20905, partial [Persicimonas sp.]